MKTSIGPSLWTQFKPEDIRRLRQIARRHLERMGGPIALRILGDDSEFDKWLESRLENVIHYYVEALRRGDPDDARFLDRVLSRLN